MASVFSILGLLFGASFIISIEGLACYDNIFNDDGVVLIGCDFPGAACATTIKKTNTTGRNGTKTEVYYHCAKRWTSCKAGPLNHCTSNKNVECDTLCCDSNKCNSPQNGTSVDIPEGNFVCDPEPLTYRNAPPNWTTECYQLIGRRSERVKCLFKNAECLYVEIKSTTPTWLHSGEQDTKYITSQYCASPRQCNQTKESCDIIDALAFLTEENCSMKCCSTRRCNPLPPNHRYIEKEVPEIDDQKIRHNWTGPRNYLTTAPLRTTTLCMVIFLCILLSCAVACRRKVCGKKRRPVQHTTSTNAYVAGYGDASQTV